MVGEAARVGVKVGVLVGTLVGVLVGAGTGVDGLDGVLVRVFVGRAVAVNEERGALAGIARVALAVVLASEGVIGKVTDGTDVGVGDGVFVAVGDGESNVVRATAVGVSANATVVTSEVGLSTGSMSITRVGLPRSTPINAIRAISSTSKANSLARELEGSMFESPT